MFKRIAAMAFILAGASAAWLFLSTTIHSRTYARTEKLGDAVGGLWGHEHCQQSPTGQFEWETVKPGPGPNEVSREERERHRRPAVLAGSSVKVDLDLDYRKKGLIWFPTYVVGFDATYAIENPEDAAVKATIYFPFPTYPALYDNLLIEAPGAKDLEYRTVADDRGGAQNRVEAAFSMPPKSVAKVRIAYQSRGMDRWSYAFGKEVSIIKNLTLVMDTNFSKIDFPNETISPDQKDENKGGPGWTLTWQKDSLVSGFKIGMEMPRRLNPGPLASAMSSHAPVSLLFYFFVIFLLQTLRGLRLHPMNYFFIACAFFSFNLLFSYLVDHISLRAAFAAASVVSILLVVSYLQIVVSARFALLEAGLSQFFYQVLFAFAHFWAGYTGLAITVGAILTLAVVMRATAKIDWEEIFADPGWGDLMKKRRPRPTGLKPGLPPAPPPLG